MPGAGSASIPCARPAGSAGQVQWPSNRLQPQLGLGIVCFNGSWSH